MPTLDYDLFLPFVPAGSSPDELHATSHAYVEQEYLDGRGGWVPDEGRLALRIEQRREFDWPLFGALAETMGWDAPKDGAYCQWRYLDRALAKHGLPPWKPQYQQRGTCVGQGYKLALDYVMAIQEAALGIPFPGRASVAGVYAGGRVDAANRPGSWDGSNGIWTVDWLTEEGGVLLLKALGLAEDDQRQDEALAVRWAASRQGVPEEHERAALQRPVKGWSLVRSAREVRIAHARGFVVVQCSTLIPGGQRGKHGISRVRRAGGHCTLIGGSVPHPETGEPLFNYLNSWSERWGTGPRYPDDMPAGSVWIPEADMDAICRQNDTYALWFVDDPEAHRVDYAV